MAVNFLCFSFSNAHRVRITVIIIQMMFFTELLTSDINIKGEFGFLVSFLWRFVPEEMLGMSSTCHIDRKPGCT